MKGNAWNYVIILTVGIWLGIFAAFYGTERAEEKEQVIQEQETKIEQLQSRNATLQQERDDVYIQYWELSRSLERECSK